MRLYWNKYTQSANLYRCTIDRLPLAEDFLKANRESTILEKETNKVPVFKKTACSAPALFLAVIGIPICIYILKFYTDVVGVEIARRKAGLPAVNPLSPVKILR